MIGGRAWCFGDDVNTDVIMPGSVYDLSEAEQTKAAFAAIRPGFSDSFEPGDIIVGGRNFGTGSSRPAARSLRNLGCSILVADSITSMFLRNCVNFGLLAVECPGISRLVGEGDLVAFDLDLWTVENKTSGRMLTATPVPPRLLDMMLHGGIFPVLERQGLISPLAGS